MHLTEFKCPTFVLGVDTDKQRVVILTHACTTRGRIKGTVKKAALQCKYMYTSELDLYCSVNRSLLVLIACAAH